MTQLLEFTSDESGTIYYVCMENNNTQSYARVFSDGKIELLKKIKK